MALKRGELETSVGKCIMNPSVLNMVFSLGPVYEFVCISFRTDNLNCFRAS
jgi:hypothetical protein